MVLFLALNCAKGGEMNLRARTIESIAAKDSVTILITDSGLGGVSVAARLEAGLRERGSFRSVRLVFCNALPDLDYQYNQMADPAEKASVFNAALEGMVGHYHPDLILIACNTLSVVYPLTSFATQSETPVIDIVGFGVDDLLGRLQADSLGRAIVLGTPTTIEQDSHRQALVDRGISPERILIQPCAMLEGEIQLAPESDVVRTMIEMYAWEAAEKQPVSPAENLYLGLCCTHYGYVSDVFQSVFTEVTGAEVTVVDPTLSMSRFLLGPELGRRFDTTAVTVEIVSRVELTPEETGAIARLLRPVSAATADALLHYKLDRGLFTP